MHTINSPITICMLGLLLACASVRAEMYKWVDERGVVTYTNVPPADAKLRGRLELVSPGTPAVSTYSPTDSMNTMGTSNIGNQERSLKERVEQLERELAAERRAREMTKNAAKEAAREAVHDLAASRAAQEAQKQKELRERCQADRRIDCDSANLGDLAGEGAPVVVVRRLAQQLVVQPLVIRVPRHSPPTYPVQAMQPVHRAHPVHQPPEPRPAPAGLSVPAKSVLGPASRFDLQPRPRSY